MILVEDPRERRTPAWEELVPSLAGRCVLVVGDVMLDDYLAGDARRVCPEAPVPVIDGVRRWAVPGGAANAAANIAALGGRAMLGGIVGRDAAADDLVQAARSSGIDPSGLIADPDRPTSVTMRMLARGQQVIRVDFESIAPPSRNLADRLASWVERELGQADAVLLSDYGKGTLANGMAPRLIAAVNGNRPVIVDPKGRDATRYRGATVVKPNLSELGDLTGMPTANDDEVMAAGQHLAERLESTTIVVTRGAEGMTCFRAGLGPTCIAAGTARRVYDVTGAGDTAAAAMALALAAGHDMTVAMQIANVAAGLVVSKVGTTVVTPAELTQAEPS